MVKKIFPLLIVLSISVFASWSLLTPGFIPTHDGEYHLIRLWQFDKMVKNGILFPRWAPDLNSGFGVPLFNFFYPLPNYIGEFFHLLGFSFIDSFKLTLAAGMIAGSVLFYLWAKSLFGVWAGVIGSIFYTLAPYHLLDLYVRGTPGEILALAFFPAILWAIERKSLWASFFLALLILSHNILAAIFMPFLLSYMAFLILTSPREKKKHIRCYMLYVVGSGFALSAFFWLPAVIEAKYVNGLNFIGFNSHFPALFQLIFPSWGTGFSVPGIMDQMSFQIGIPHFLLVLSSVFFIFKTPYMGFFLFWFIIAFFLLLEISLPFWRLFPGVGLIQYPWRLLSLTILVASSLAASLVHFKKAKLLIGILFALAVLFYGNYTKPVKYPPRTDNFYLDNPNWTNGTATLGNTFSTIWLPSGQEKRERKLEIASKIGQIKKQDIKPELYIFQVEANKSVDARVNTSYFPGWKVWINGKETAINFDNGLINFKIPEGENLIEIKFTDTPIRCWANNISLFSLFFILILAILKIRRIKINK